MRDRIRGVVAIATATAMLSCAGAAVAASSGKLRPAPAPRTTGHLVYRGTVNLSAVAGAPSSSMGAAPQTKSRLESPLQAKRSPRPATRAPNPAAAALRTAAGSSTVSGFVGLTTDQSTQVNGLDVEPPDQGLCAHNGTMIEAVNLALRVYDENGVALTQPVTLNSFFGLSPVFSNNGGHTTFGPFVSDPRCYYDPQTGRWFVAVLEIDLNPYTGNFGYRSSELIAVSQTSDPTGNWGLFSFDTTNDGTDGTPSEPNCPCFGDQPRIGADANGFYISTDSYPIHGLFNDNGGELYALSKQGLAAAASGTAPPPTLVAIHVGAVTIEGFPANAVQPATTPEGGSYATNREYFLSTPDYNGFATMGGKGDKAVMLWALSGTQTLSKPFPTVTLNDVRLPSEPFTPPVPARQKPGPLPLGGGSTPPTLSINDDRMEQVEYVNGKLYSSLNTGVGPSGKANRSGIAWFEVTTAGQSGHVSHQGYLASGDGASLMYPAIGLDKTGAGAMTFSVSGPTIYPSAAYVPFNVGPTSTTISITSAGSAPEDGFTCFAPFGPPCRWGDYSAASSDGAGRIVMATELIPNDARVPTSNWGTFLAVLKP